jgi:hypothetical protein
MDPKGDRQWKRVEVKLEEHVNVPIFPAGLSPTSYDAYLDDYLSKVAMDQFPQSKPLWEVHIFKYPTSNAAGISYSSFIIRLEMATLSWGHYFLAYEVLIILLLP